MQLIGQYDSPYVRRVAICLHLLGRAYEHRPLSVFGDFEEFRTINPVVKVPTLVLDDGTVLVESELILAWLQRDTGVSLLPVEDSEYVSSLVTIGLSLAFYEKVAGLIYERHQRPEEKRHPAWIERLVTQLQGAGAALEAQLDGRSGWLFGDQPGLADITLGVTWGFSQLRAPQEISLADHPNLAAFAARCEALPAFRACPIQ